MSLFRKKKWDIERSEQNKGLIRQLFNQAMPDGDTWKIVYGYGLNIKTSDYIIARKTTYTYTSLIIGYRESDMSIALLQTTPELEGCSEAEIFTRDSIKEVFDMQLNMLSSPWHMIGACAITVALALLGCLFGQRILRRHFQKAGIVK